MERLFDLPAHPLLVHFPVVAIPAVALAGIWIAISPSGRRKYGPLVVVAAVVTVITTFLAAASGNALSDALELTDDHIGDHRSLGNVLRILVLLMGVFIAGVVALGDRSYNKRQAAVEAATASDGQLDTEPPSTALATVVRLGAIAFGLLSIVWVIRTGHEGAKSVWEGQLRDDESAAAVTTEATTVAPATTSEAVTTPDDDDDDHEDDDDDDKEADDETVASTEAPETTLASVTEVEDIDPVAIYAANCARCHGDDGVGTRGPNLVNFSEKYPEPGPAITLINEGKGGMPAFGTKLSADEISALVDHLYTAFNGS